MSRSSHSRLAGPSDNPRWIVSLAAARLRRRQEVQGDRAEILADPVLFARQWLGVDLWSAQEEILRSVRDEARTAVRKCHASGGTLAAAIACCWWLTRYEDGAVITLAPTADQLVNHLWRDLDELHRTSKWRLEGKVHRRGMRWEFPGSRRFALGRSTDTPERLQGAHAGHLLVIIDEASGFSEELREAVEGMLASGHARLLMLSQPTQLSGWFYEACNSGHGLYNVIHIDAFDTPNLEGLTAEALGELAADALDEDERAYLIGRRWVLEREREWGQDSYMYQVRVRGNFPDQASDALIRLSWAEKAKDHPVKAGEYALGVDVARFGADFTAFSLLKGNQLIEQWRRQGQDLMQTAGEIIDLSRRYPALTIVVDDTGLGGGVIDRLREQDIAVTAVNFGEKPRRDENVVNRGTEIWVALAEALKQGELAFSPRLPTLKLLTGQLVQATYSFDSSGRRRLHKKGRDDRLDSPDLADSLALAWAGLQLGAYDPVACSLSIEPPTRRSLFHDMTGVPWSDWEDQSPRLRQTWAERSAPSRPEPEPEPLENACPDCNRICKLEELGRTGYTGHFWLRCSCGKSQAVNLPVEPRRGFRYRSELQ